MFVYLFPRRVPILTRHVSGAGPRLRVSGHEVGGEGRDDPRTPDDRRLSATGSKVGTRLGRDKRRTRDDPRLSPTGPKVGTRLGKRQTENTGRPTSVCNRSKGRYEVREETNREHGTTDVCLQQVQR